MSKFNNDNLTMEIRNHFIDEINQCNVCYANAVALLTSSLPINILKNINNYNCCKECLKYRRVLNEATVEVKVYYDYLCTTHKYNGSISYNLLDWCSDAYYSSHCLKKFNAYHENEKQISNFSSIYISYVVQHYERIFRKDQAIFKKEQAAIKKKAYQKEYYQKNKEWYKERKLILDNKLVISY